MLDCLLWSKSLKISCCLEQQSKFSLLRIWFKKERRRAWNQAVHVQFYLHIPIIRKTLRSCSARQGETQTMSCLWASLHGEGRLSRGRSTPISPVLALRAGSERQSIRSSNSCGCFRERDNRRAFGHQVHTTKDPGAWKQAWNCSIAWTIGATSDTSSTAVPFSPSRLASHIPSAPTINILWTLFLLPTLFMTDFLSPHGLDMLFEVAEFPSLVFRDECLKCQSKNVKIFLIWCWFTAVKEGVLSILQSSDL